MSETSSGGVNKFLLPVLFISIIINLVGFSILYQNAGTNNDNIDVSKLDEAVSNLANSQQTLDEVVKNLKDNLDPVITKFQQEKENIESVVKTFEDTPKQLKDVQEALNKGLTAVTGLQSTLATQESNVKETNGKLNTALTDLQNAIKNLANTQPATPTPPASQPSPQPATPEPEQDNATPQRPAPARPGEMTLTRLDQLIKRVGRNVQQDPAGTWQFNTDGRKLVLVANTEVNRLRIITQIKGVFLHDLSRREYKKLLRANYSTALDARYAASGDKVFAIFVHPLKSLTAEHFNRALSQTISLAQTYGETYAATKNISFGPKAASRDGQERVRRLHDLDREFSEY